MENAISNCVDGVDGTTHVVLNDKVVIPFVIAGVILWCLDLGSN
jgi:hypothetical protein